MCELDRKGQISQVLPVRVTRRFPLLEPVGGLLVYPVNELPMPVIDIVAHLQTKTAERNISNGNKKKLTNNKKINKNKENIKLTDKNSSNLVRSVTGRSYHDGWSIEHRSFYLSWEVRDEPGANWNGRPPNRIIVGHRGPALLLRDRRGFLPE